MTSPTRPAKVWIEGTGTSWDGKVWVIPPGSPMESQRFDRPSPDALLARPHVHLTRSTIPMAPTGVVRWDGDEPIEVWAPADRLEVWLAEHDVDP